MLALVLVLVLAATLAVGQRASALSLWSRETVDDPNDTAVGLHSAIALDSSGTRHIAYFDYHNARLKYARKLASGTWQIEVVDAPTNSSGAFGEGVSIALDANGRPHLSYYGGYVDVTGIVDLRYAKRICSFPLGCRWIKETVDAQVFAAGASGNTSLALDGAGNPHISYFDNPRGQLKWAKREGSAWGITDVAATPGGRTSMALDSNGFPHIGYSDVADYPPQVKYAKVTCQFIFCGWEVETLDIGVLGNLKLDAGGAAHLTYRGQAYSVKYAVRSCSTPTTCSWNAQTVESTYGAASRPWLALTSGGTPRIVFVTSDGVLRHAWKQGFIWTTEAADSPVTPYADVSMVLDPNNNPHVSYQESVQFSLRYAKKTPVVKSPPSS
jgi:hypothetical protein